TRIAPLLEDAMAALDETDRTAVLLRFFENKSLRDVGETLGASEDAAQKRVSRAVEQLREFLSKQSIAVGASGLVVLISTNAVQSAPAGLNATILTATTGTTTALGTTLIYKALLIGATAVAVGTGIYAVHTTTKNKPSFAAAPSSVPVDRVTRLKERLNQKPSEKIPELRFLTGKNWLHAANLTDLKTDDDFLKAFSDLRASAKMTFGKMMHSVLWNYAHSNGGSIPTNMAQLSLSLKSPMDETILARYELMPLPEKYIVRQDALGDPPSMTGREPILLEKAPVNPRYDTRLEISMSVVGTYGMEYYAYTNGIPPEKP
ncbi:MAG TPA: sigma factor-like helix-turn-helix DNA-binding protein, partial [Desulfuromonadaceae bacterium]|nr:sigma factor-like helix-turn-helix DNA-binding protein [Desulfuromonadaceae bacterium]